MHQIYLLIILCMLSCEKEEGRIVDEVDDVISLGEIVNISFPELERINKYDFNKQQVMVKLADENSLNISPKIAGKTQIKIYHDKDQTKIINITTPSDVFVIEDFIMDIVVSDYDIYDSIKKDIKSNAFTRYSEFFFDIDSILIFTQVDEDIREETSGKYYFDISKVEIIFPETVHRFKYEESFKNIQNNNVFIEDLTNYFKGKYPNVKIESVLCIYKVEKLILPG